MVLRKLLHLCLGTVPAGLAAGTVPIYLRLHRFTDEILNDADPLGRLIEQEVAERSKDKFPAGSGLSLWASGGPPLLLLFDGLDEIADGALRAKVAGWLKGTLTDAAVKKRVKAVVSCRRAVYDSDWFGSDGAVLEIQALDDDRITDVIRLWFDDAYRSPGRGSPADAKSAADDLRKKLKSEAYAAEQIKALVATPLMLTLLCQVVLGGKEIPKRRVEFYEECLGVLLQRWDQAKNLIPPLDQAKFKAALQVMAWTLLKDGETDLVRSEAINLIEERLGRDDGAKVLDWLCDRAGVLVANGSRRYHFQHLGFQNYLAAAHVAVLRGALVRDLAEQRPSEPERNEAWREVVQLVAGLADLTLFAELAEALLKGIGQPGCAELLRECLAQASRVDLCPFLARLRPGGDPVIQEIVLRLLIDHTDPGLRDAARVLIDAGAEPRVKALAEQVYGRDDGKQRESCDLLVVGAGEDVGIADDLTKRLHNLAIRVYDRSRSWLDKTEEVAEAVSAVVVVVGSSCPWQDREMKSGLRLLERHRLKVVLVTGPGVADDIDVPEFLKGKARIAWSKDVEWDVSSVLLNARTGSGAPASPSGNKAFVAAAATGALTEPRTGLRLLPIPAGQFEMGAEDLGQDERPIRRVEVDEFLLGETPVTNGQYKAFLLATGHEEPLDWRNGRFSHPDQPVTSVSWGDAVKYCAWASEKSRYRFSLPTQEQWEYAARGGDGRKYPWGNEPPTPSLACFGLDSGKGQPARVGSFPDGRGPFGTLDQAGNVWEWCADKWKPSSKGVCATRGGGWQHQPKLLRAAYCYGHQVYMRLNVVGFRVAASLV
jgi:formylglycine-generating enzyme required for sulfatase activity